MIRNLAPLMFLILPLAQPATGAEAIDSSEFEPDITIIQRESQRIEEYRVGGQVVMIRIIPAKGRPYYLIDSDGDGNFETRRNDLDPPALVQWQLLRW
jgi:hypothetical protein